ncbi:MAG: hypothetical protein JSV64_04495 [Candidatus Bathyarchaeota archaeon]|nr:MAG: hypothetical protein JSV64_04495 [Candidatus Bathyarchaeota archaeon]
MIKKSVLSSIFSIICVGMLIASVHAPPVPRAGWSHSGLRREGSYTQRSGIPINPSGTISGGFGSGSIIPDATAGAPAMVIVAIGILSALIYFARRRGRKTKRVDESSHVD